MGTAVLIYTSSQSAPEHFSQGCVWFDKHLQCLSEAGHEHKYEKKISFLIDSEMKFWTLIINLQKHAKENTYICY